MLLPPALPRAAAKLPEGKITLPLREDGDAIHMPSESLVSNKASRM
jgi:hypothetical protein